MPLTAGARLGPYEIVASLGAGGMGEVYRARDTRLRRDVALKVLPESFATDPARRRRFEQEAHAVAALNQPHICQIYDVGPDYLVLELVEGYDLRGPQPEAHAAQIALQIAGALETAHARGILHRDLKPSNVLVTADGVAKLLDFGIAKLDGGRRDVTMTADGTVLGTAAYMSPEQAKGAAVDARSDIFSFGALLYELVAGRRAFDGDTVGEVLGALLQSDPAPLEAAPAIDRVVRRCLQKDPARRYQSAAELRAALDAVAASTAKRMPSIAVLPFQNMSGDKDNEYFSDGLAEEVINALARIPGLKVIARTSAFAFKGKNEDIRRIADTLGVSTVLEGSVRRAGNRLRVTAQLITAADGSHLWSERYDRELTDVFEIQDFIAKSIADALKVKLVAPEQPRHTPPLPAFEALLQGRHFTFRQTPGSGLQAKAHFEKAIALDPHYADPHVSLGFSYFGDCMVGGQSLHELAGAIRTEANTALALDPSNLEPHFLLGTVAVAYDYDWETALRHFELSLTADNTSAEAHWAYASLYLQPRGRLKEAADHMERAVARDPLNAHWRGVFVSHLSHAGLFERAIREAEEAIRIDSAQFSPYTTLGEAYVMLERWADAIPPLEHARVLIPTFSMNLGFLAGAHVRAGNRERGAEMLRALDGTARPPIGRALYHVVVGELDLAAQWYERAIHERDPFALVFAACRPLNVLRETPHWPRLAGLMRLPHR